MSDQRTIVIVPAYNEEKNITKVIADLSSTLSLRADIIVINDGSLDRTYELALATGKAIVVDLPTNLGIGGAVQTGLKYALRNGYEIAIQFDGDGQHKASEIPKILGPVVRQEADIVIGSRFLEKTDGFRSTFTRRIGIRFFQLLNSLLIRQNITDNTSGFRAYSRDAIEFLSHYYPTDYPEPEAVILCAKNGLMLKEVSVEMRERQGGASSISGIKSLYYMVKVTLAVIMTAMRKHVR